MEEVKQEKSKIKTLTIIIVIMALVILGLGGYLVYKEFFAKNDTKEPTPTIEPTNSPKPTDEPKKQVLATESEVKTYIKELDYIIRYFNDYTYYPLDISDLSNQFILTSGLYEFGSLPESFTKEDLDKNIISIYGKDISYNHEDIECFAKDGPLYKYDGAKYTYVVDGHGHGGNGSVRSKAYFVEAIVDKEKGTIDVEEKILYGDYCGDICGPVINFSDSKEDGTVLYKNTDDSLKDFDDVYPLVKDKLSITVFHFEKDSKGNYGLKSVSVK